MAAPIILLRAVIGLRRTGISIVHRHNRVKGRPGPRPFPAAALLTRIAGAARTCIIGEVRIIIPLVPAVGKGAGNAAQGSKVVAASAGLAAGIAGGTTMIVIAAAAMMMAAGRTAAATACGRIVRAIHLRIAVIAARTTARTVFFHICHERIRLSSEASASRDTLYAMPNRKKGFIQ